VVVGVVAVAVACLAGVTAVARPRSRAPFPLVMLVAALCVGVLVTTGLEGAVVPT